jgi:hypothetical protein
MKKKLYFKLISNKKAREQSCTRALKITMILLILQASFSLFRQSYLIQVYRNKRRLIIKHR